MPGCQEKDERMGSITGTLASLSVTNLLALFGFFVLWIVLFQCAHVVVPLLRTTPLLGWAVGPLGLAPLFLHEPSTLTILLNALFPALVSGAVVYIALFTQVAPLALPQFPLIEALVIVVGVLLTSTNDLLRAYRDLRYPLWGEARILRTIQSLRASYASIHFTSLGYSYLRDHFGSNPTDVLKAF